MIDLSLAVVIVGVALFIRGMTGFGGALIMVPFLSLLWDIRQAVVIIALLNLASGAFLVATSRAHIVRRDVIGLAVWSLPGLGIGAVALAFVDVDIMTIVLGVFTILASLHLMFRRRQEIEPNPPNHAVEGGVGLLAGTLHGMLGTSGPVIVPYFAHRISIGTALRASLLAYLLTLDLLRMSSYVVFGLVDRGILVTGLILIPIAFAAGYLGGNVQARLPERTFRLLVASLLLFSGVMLLVR